MEGQNPLLSQLLSGAYTHYKQNGEEAVVVAVKPEKEKEKEEKEETVEEWDAGDACLFCVAGQEDENEPY